jgi:hypothetical protein
MVASGFAARCAEGLCLSESQSLRFARLCLQNYPRRSLRQLGDSPAGKPEDPHIRRQSRKQSRSLTRFSGSAYSLFALFMTRKHYYYWCACRFASPQGGAAGRCLCAGEMAI